MRTWLKVTIIALIVLATCTGLSFAAKLATMPDDIAVAGGVCLAIATLFLAVRLSRATLRLLAVSCVAVVATIATGCARVPPGHVGIVVNMAGGNKGVANIPTTTGWTFYNPIGTTVYQYPTYVQTAKWTKSPDEGAPRNEEITFTNKDAMLVAADVSLSYSLLPEKVPAFYVKFRSDDLDLFTHGYLRNVARDCFNETAGRFSIEQIMGDNGPFLAEVRTRLQREVEPIGVHIEQFGFIGAPRPPDAIVGSINAKVQASQIAQQKQNEIIQVQAEATKRVTAAEGDAKAAIAKAEGEAKANQILAQSVTPTLIQWRSLEIQQQAVARWNGARPQVEGGSSGLLLQLSPPKQ